MGGGPRVVVSTAAFHARVRGSVPGLGGLKETKLFLPHPRVKVSIVGSLRDREVACSASDRQGSNFESCVWRTVSSQSSHHPQEVLLAQFSLYVHKGGLKPDSFHLFIQIVFSDIDHFVAQRSLIETPHISAYYFEPYFTPRCIGVLKELLVVVFSAPIRRGSLGICSVCWMLWQPYAEALVYSNHPRAAAASSYLAIIFGRIASGVSWFLRSAAEPMQHPHQRWRWCRPWKP